jgi:predicted DNA-binding transcriptional regulator YafY
MTDGAEAGWLFLTDHGAVLLSIAGDPTIGIKDLARLTGVSEQTAEKILDDLVAESYVIRERDGRRNRYEINRTAHLRHPLFEDVEIGPLVDALQASRSVSREARAR